MMVSFVVRDAIGMVLRTGTCAQSDIPLQADVGEIAEQCPADVTDETHYYNGSAYVTRPDFSLSYGSLSITTAETLSITGIPVGTTVYHPEGVNIIDDGQADWSCVEPGTYTLSFENFPYKPESLDVNVTAA